MSNLQLLRLLGPVAAISSLMNMFMMLEAHIYVPYLYTRVRCCTGEADMLSSDHDIMDPDLVRGLQAEARALDLKLQVSQSDTIEACSVPAFPGSSPMWSLSPHCTNKAYVQQSAQSVIATMKPLQKMFCFFVLPIGGALADGVGRRPVLALYGSGLLVACLLSALDAHVAGAYGNWIVYVAGCLFGLSFQPKDSILGGVIADIMGKDEVSKGRAFVALRSVDTVGTFFLNICVYLYLRTHRDNHYYAWLAFSGLASMIVFVIRVFMRETLPQTTTTPAYSEMFNPFVSQYKAFSLVARDKVLMLQAALTFVFYAYFLGFITTRTSYLTLVGFRMEDAMLPEILATCFVFFFAMVLMPLLPQLGVWHMSTLGNMLFFVGYMFVGPFTVLVSNSGPYIASVTFALAILLIFPAFQTIVSQRVEQEHQSKIQAAIFAFGTLGAVVGIPIYNKVLFDATASGIDKARCPLVSMGLSLGCALLSLAITYTARRVEPPGSKAEKLSGQQAPL